MIVWDKIAVAICGSVPLLPLLPLLLLLLLLLWLVLIIVIIPQGTAHTVHPGIDEFRARLSICTEPKDTHVAKTQTEQFKNTIDSVGRNWIRWVLRTTKDPDSFSSHDMATESSLCSYTTRASSLHGHRTPVL